MSDLLWWPINKGAQTGSDRQFHWSRKTKGRSIMNDTPKPAQAGLEAARERLSGSACLDADEVRIYFDWELPQRVDEEITFQVRISRRGQHSAISFAIALAKLVETDLERLHDLLTERPKGYWLTRELTWSDFRCANKCRS
jgi:hypothetical protein